MVSGIILRDDAAFPLNGSLARANPASLTDPPSPPIVPHVPLLIFQLSTSLQLNNCRGLLSSTVFPLRVSTFFNVFFSRWQVVVLGCGCYRLAHKSHLKVMSPFGGSIGIGENCFIPSLRRSFPHDRTDDKKKTEKFYFYHARCLALVSSYCSKVPPSKTHFRGLNELIPGMENAAWRKLWRRRATPMSCRAIPLNRPSANWFSALFLYHVAVHRETYSSRVQRFHSRFISRAVEVSVFKNCSTHRSPHKWITRLLLYLLPLGTYTRRNLFCRTKQRVEKEVTLPSVAQRRRAMKSFSGRFLGTPRIGM